MFSCAPECSKQLPLQRYIANWGGGGVLGHRINAKISPKAASGKAQTTVSETSPKIDAFRTVILTLLAPTGDNARASFLLHQVPRTSATVLQYRRMFTQFSLRV